MSFFTKNPNLKNVYVFLLFFLFFFWSWGGGGRGWLEYLNK